MVDYYVHEAREELVSDEEQKIPKRFLTAVATESMKRRGDEAFPILTKDRPTGYYHQHDESCPECEDSDSEEDD